ncbi:hypothetical protein J2W14_004058 [Pseudarthrobacter oxydans]|nr:hypothetical protein [Pseudarthrobacter oxydans]
MQADANIINPAPRAPVQALPSPGSGTSTAVDLLMLMGFPLLSLAAYGNS